MPNEVFQVDPKGLRLPGSRVDGADPAKLARHISKFGTGTQGMPIIEVTRGKDGEMMINSGVTRATRVAKLLPGTLVEVVVIDERPKWNLTKLPTVGEKLP